jgi:uncharacterized protein YabE (DUF348 family)
MSKRQWYLLAVACILAGLALSWFGTARPIDISIDGGSVQVKTRAVKVGQVLAQAGIAIGDGDQVYPAINARIGWNAIIDVRRAHRYTVYDGINSLPQTLLTVDSIPANVLSALGISLYPGDEILWNGEQIDAGDSISDNPAVVLQLKRAVPVKVIEENGTRTFYSAASSLGKALWQNQLSLNSNDYLSMPAETKLSSPLAVNIKHAIPIMIKMKDREVNTSSAAVTVGQALSESGISLQGLDYSIPSDEQPIPGNGVIRVVRVHEEVTIQQTPIPFENEFVADSELELDQRSILEPGQYGVKVSRQRIRFEDDEQVATTTDAEWTAVEPISQVLGFGTKVVIHTIDTPSGRMEYWRAATVYATSYSPCRLGVVGCNDITASGAKLEKGIIAVSCSVFSTYRGMRLYVPGYGVGTISDCGGTIPGKFLVDLGYSDDDYQSWHQSMTVYFLTPVPATIPYIFP